MLRTVAGSCTDGQTCPAVYTDTDDPTPATVLVRGYLEQRPELDLPDGEVLVRVPAGMLTEAAQRLP
jgi:hypothetical protein